MITYLIIGFQFYDKYDNFLKLNRFGIITTAKRTYIPINKIFVNSRLEFVKADSTIYSNTNLTVDERDFVKEKSEFKIIYLIDKPERYWKLENYENYSVGFSFFFFFGPCSLIGGLFL